MFECGEVCAGSSEVETRLNHDWHLGCAENRNAARKINIGHCNVASGLVFTIISWPHREARAWAAAAASMVSAQGTSGRRGGKEIDFVPDSQCLHPKMVFAVHIGTLRSRKAITLGLDA